MPFTLGQMFGGWGKKGGAKKAPRGEGEFRSHRARAEGIAPAMKRGSSASDANEASPKAAISKSTAIKGESNLAWELIKAPHISEKATMPGENKYIFKVSNKSTKGTLRRAIEERYKVDVESLNILIMPAKKRRRGNIVGLKSGFKKAIIALKTGQTISEF